MNGPMNGPVSARTAPPGLAGRPVAVVVARDGAPPAGAGEAVAEAGGAAIVVGSGTERAAKELAAAERIWWCDTGAAVRFGALAERLAPVLAASPLVVLPASPDGRDLAPRLAAVLGRPLLAQGRLEVGQRRDDLVVRVGQQPGRHLVDEPRAHARSSFRRSGKSPFGTPLPSQLSRLTRSRRCSPPAGVSVVWRSLSAW